MLAKIHIIHTRLTSVEKRERKKERASAFCMVVKRPFLNPSVGSSYFAPISSVLTKYDVVAATNITIAV